MSFYFDTSYNKALIHELTDHRFNPDNWTANSSDPELLNVQSQFLRRYTNVSGRVYYRESATLGTFEGDDDVDVPSFALASVTPAVLKTVGGDTRLRPGARRAIPLENDMDGNLYTPRITRFEYTIGGTDRTGKVVKGSMDIELAGNDFLEDILENVAVIGNKIRFICSAGFSVEDSIKDQSAAANKFEASGRVYNFKYTNTGKSYQSWKVTIDIMGTTDAYMQLKVDADINPNSTFYPFKYKTVKVKDGTAKNISSIAELFAAYFQETRSEWNSDKYGYIKTSEDLIFGFDKARESSEITNSFINFFSGDNYENSYISLGSILILINKLVKYLGKRSFDVDLENTEFRFADDAKGTCPDYLVSCNPGLVVFAGQKYCPATGDAYYIGDKNTTDKGILHLTNTQTPDYYSRNLDAGDLSNVMISQYVILDFFSTITANNPNGNNIQESTFQQFFKQLFSQIRAATGGLVDLDLYTSLKDAASVDETLVYHISDRNIQPDDPRSLPPPLGFYIYATNQRLILNYDKNFKNILII